MNAAVNEERFWSYVQKRGPSDCWEWQGSRGHRGHGRFRVGQKVKKAHRIAYMLTYGDLADDLEVGHACGNPPCCNPEHLFVATHKETIYLAIRQGRMGKRGYDIADAIRDDYATGRYTHRHLAAKYQLAHSMVTNILTGKQWADMTAVTRGHCHQSPPRHR
jgi:hypothetical protein